MLLKVAAATTLRRRAAGAPVSVLPMKDESRECVRLRDALQGRAPGLLQSLLHVPATDVVEVDNDDDGDEGMNAAVDAICARL